MSTFFCVLQHSIITVIRVLQRFNGPDCVTKKKFFKDRVKRQKFVL